MAGLFQPKLCWFCLNICLNQADPMTRIHNSSQNIPHQKIESFECWLLNVHTSPYTSDLLFMSVVWVFCVGWSQLDFKFVTNCSISWPIRHQQYWLPTGLCPRWVITMVGGVAPRWRLKAAWISHWKAFSPSAPSFLRGREGGRGDLLLIMDQTNDVTENMKLMFLSFL